MHSLHPRCAFFWTKISTGDCVTTWSIIRGVCAADRMAGIENGELLRKAVETRFDVLVTMDSNMVHQQNIERHAIAVVALRAASNRLADTRPLMLALSRVAPKYQARYSDVSA